MALSEYNLHCKTSCIDIMIWLMCGQAKMDNEILSKFLKNRLPITLEETGPTWERAERGRIMG